MRLELNSITLHNFMSFGDATIDLKNRSYCTVKGINLNPKDQARSNGSGKSSIWSGILWALIGETIHGIKTNVVNLNTTGGCFVTLDFNYDNHHYIITRYREYEKIGNSLKIVIDGEDKSGKTLRDSQALLDQYLPDLNRELIASVIILGQGLPYKFSSNTPSGRKELLEKLSKTDFMINDIKDRISNRLNVLNNTKRTQEDELLQLDTKKELNESNLEKLKNEYATLNVPQDFENDIKQLESTINSLNLKKSQLENDISNKEQELNNLITEYNEVNKLRDAKGNAIVDESQKLKTTAYNNLMEVKAQLKIDRAELERLESITDICPTCHQKIVGIEKPDTTPLKESIEQNKKLEAQYNEELANIQSKLQEDLSHALIEYDDALEKNQFVQESLKNDIKSLRYGQSQVSNELTTNHSALATIKEKANSFQARLTKLSNDISTLESEIATEYSQIAHKGSLLDETTSRVELVNKMLTFAKRDFRGILLSGIIDYIKAKGKEYSQVIFGNEDFDLVLDGNNIDIIYCNKVFETLSGGEQQKVDLILQFAIRDMMCKYLDFSCNILVLDEIFDQLDSIGCERVLDLISTKLNDIESIFIISHRADELQIPSDSEIIVEKDIYGISKVR